MFELEGFKKRERKTKEDLEEKNKKIMKNLQLHVMMEDTQNEWRRKDNMDDH